MMEAKLAAWRAANGKNAPRLRLPLSSSNIANKAVKTVTSDKKAATSTNDTSTPGSKWGVVLKPVKSRTHPKVASSKNIESKVRVPASVSPLEVIETSSKAIEELGVVGAKSSATPTGLTAESLKESTEGLPQTKIAISQEMIEPADTTPTLRSPTTNQDDTSNTESGKEGQFYVDDDSASSAPASPEAAHTSSTPKGEVVLAISEQPGSGVKERRKRRTTMFVKGAATPDDKGPPISVMSPRSSEGSGCGGGGNSANGKSRLEKTLFSPEGRQGSSKSSSSSSGGDGLVGEPLKRLSEGSNESRASSDTSTSPSQTSTTPQETKTAALSPSFDSSLPPSFPSPNERRSSLSSDVSSVSPGSSPGSANSFKSASGGGGNDDDGGEDEGAAVTTPDNLQVGCLENGSSELRSSSMGSRDEQDDERGDVKGEEQGMEQEEEEGAEEHRRKCGGSAEGEFSGEDGNEGGASDEESGSGSGSGSEAEVGVSELAWASAVLRAKQECKHDLDACRTVAATALAQAEAKADRLAEEHDALHFLNEVQAQELEAKGKAFSKTLESLHKKHRSEVKALGKGAVAAETKHAAYTEALTTQMKQGLLAAVKQCKALERSLQEETALRVAAQAGAAVMAAENKELRQKLGPPPPPSPIVADVVVAEDK